MIEGGTTRPGKAAAAVDRRWSPIVAALVAGVLIFVVLPNPLRVPQSNPTASAEYAPVPGRQDSAKDANFGETELATSGGLGSGGEGEGLLPGTPPPPPPLQYRPRQKNCVGNPPRQTEDPLSPPCVPFWEGENGGSTWKGVTRDEIKIAYYNDFKVRGDMSTPYKPSDESGAQADYYYTNHVRTVKALLRYFSARYQTYGRRVHVEAYASGGGLGTAPTQRRGEALELYHKIKPFGVTALVENIQSFVPVMAEFEVPSFGWNEDVPPEVYEDNAPYFWSFMPDQATEAAWSASFICRKLKDRPARFTDDQTLKGKTRKFGLLHPQKGSRGPFLEQLATLLKLELRKQCGMDFDQEYRFAGTGQGDAPSVMARWKREGVTTVVCYCIPQINELTVPAMQNAATSLSYFPEWYWDHASAMDRPLWQQEYGRKEHKGFGVTYLWRQPAFKESYAYRAYLDEEPDTVPNLRFNFELYHVFLNLFSGIQAAGPNLTPETIKRGMFTFYYNNLRNPWIPTGGYGPTGPSRYTFVHSAMGWWWDPIGTPPGGKTREGCQRVIRDGRRTFTGDWPKGDADLFLPGDPCSDDTRRMVEP